MQLGQSYGDYLDLNSHAGEEAMFSALCDRLSGIWVDAFFRQLTTAALLPGNPLAALNPEIDQSIRAQMDEVRTIGHASMTELLQELTDEASGPADFPRFFQAWVTACDKAYAQLVRSPLFSRLLAQITNACIELASAGQRS